MISSVTNASTNNSNSISKAKNYERQIQALEKQKSLINDQISRMKNSNADQKTKEDTIKELQQQISSIDAQICSIKSEEMSHKDEIEKVKNNKKDDNKQNKIINNEDSKETQNINKLAEALVSASDISKMYKLKKNLKVKINNLNYEMSTKSGPTAYKIAQVEKLSENISRIDIQINKKYKNMKNNIKKSSDITKKAKEEKIENKKRKIQKESKDLRIEINNLA